MLFQTPTLVQIISLKAAYLKPMGEENVTLGRRQRRERCVGAASWTCENASARNRVPARFLRSLAYSGPHFERRSEPTAVSGTLYFSKSYSLLILVGMSQRLEMGFLHTLCWVTFISTHREMYISSVSIPTLWVYSGSKKIFTSSCSSKLSCYLIEYTAVFTGIRDM